MLPLVVKQYYTVNKQHSQGRKRQNNGIICDAAYLHLLHTVRPRTKITFFLPFRGWVSQGPQAAFVVEKIMALSVDLPRPEAVQY